MMAGSTLRGWVTLWMVLGVFGCAAQHSPPQLRRLGNVTQLCVDDKPFLALGGELGNSTASDPATLKNALDRCARMHLNTVMLPVYWDRIEPVEGTFDFSLLKSAIDDARGHNLHLVYLWFGTWKNSMSCYAPGWVKRDTHRFERVKRTSGETEEIISPQSDSARNADTRAFAALMRWTRNYDSSRGTVVMVQVENEIGMIPEPRDHSAAAETAYGSAVPDELMSRLKRDALGPEVASLWQQAGLHDRGSWGEVFGESAEGQEVFSAWSFAKYVQTVAAAGKREYALPMYANAALIRPNYRPGQYPSAGPLPHLLEVWRAGAPTLDMICPDIYFPSFIKWAGLYKRNGNPLFIPEMAPSLRATGNAVFAAAEFGAIGFGPFAIENVDPQKEKLIGNCYSILAGMSDRITRAQQTGQILGISALVNIDWTVSPVEQATSLGNVRFDAIFDRTGGSSSTQPTTLPTLGSGRWEAPPGAPLGSAMILQLAPEEVAIVGMGVTITFAPVDGKGKIGIDTVQEGTYNAAGQWVGGRWLNGDETHQGRHVQFPGDRWSVQRVKLYRYGD